jgi:hypothetical protein
MAEGERIDKRPSCGWPVLKTDDSGKPAGTRDCGSEDGVYKVAGKGRWTGRPRESNICEKHLPEAIKKWNWDTAVPVNPLCESRAVRTSQTRLLATREDALR